MLLYNFMLIDMHLNLVVSVCVPCIYLRVTINLDFVMLMKVDCYLHNLIKNNMYMLILINM